MDTKKTLCRIGAQMKEAGLVTACDGNISFRRSDGAIVITPSGVPKGELKPKHLLVVDLDGHVPGRDGGRRRPNRPSIWKFIGSEMT